MRYRILLYALVLPALLLSLCLGAFAAEPGRCYDPDDETGPAGEITSDGRTWLTSDMAYDFTTHDFVYPISDSTVEIHASVADGMAVTEPVKISGSSIQLYCRGEEYTGDLSSISEPGEYILMARSGTQSIRIMSFIILGKTSAVLYTYEAPAGMLFTVATFEGESLDYSSTSVPMEQDGRYHIEYECLATGIIYTLDMKVDRTPPSLEFSGRIDSRNRVRSALSFSGLQPDEVIVATLDGESITVSPESDGTGVLRSSGRYTITVYDAAGNSTVYYYTVLIYLNASSIAFLALLIASIAAIVIYIWIKRKNLQIG